MFVKFIFILEFPISFDFSDARKKIISSKLFNLMFLKFIFILQFPIPFDFSGAGKKL